MARFTGPVRFFLKGNRHAAMQLKNTARELINQIGNPSRRARGANGMRRVRYTDGTTITVSKVAGVYNSIIFVPQKKKDKKGKGGWIVYPYLGWLRPLMSHRVYDGGTYVQYEQPGEYAYITLKEISAIPCYSSMRSVGWKPPYYNEDGTEVLGDGVNKGTLQSTYTDIYNYLATDRSYPRRINVLGEREDGSLRTSETLYTETGDDDKYEPIAEQGAHDYGYSSYAHWLHKDHRLVWKGLPSGDLYMITVNYTDTEPWFLYGSFVYVDGKKYETPRPVRSAAILEDVKEKEKWIVITTMDNREELDYTPDDLRIFAARLTGAGLEGTDGTTVRTEAEFALAYQTDDPDFQKIRNGWYELLAGTQTVPLVATNRANYSATDRRTQYRYLADSWGFKFNANGNRFVFTNYIEGSTATEIDEVEISIDVSSYGNNSQYHVPLITHKLHDSLYSAFFRRDDVWNSGIEYSWSKLNWGAAYKDNVRHIFTVEPFVQAVQVACSESTSQVTYMKTRNETIYGTLKDKEGEPLFHRAQNIGTSTCALGTTGQATEATFFCYLDIENNDYVLETMKATMTDPINTISKWFVEYKRDVYIGHKRVGSDEGSYNYDAQNLPENASYYQTFDNAFDSYWPGGIRMAGADGIGITYPDGYDSQHNGEDRHVIYRHIKRPGWGHLCVQRGDPKYIIATYVDRSVNALTTGHFDYVPNSEIDSQYRIEQKQIIMDKDDPTVTMNLLDNIDSYGEKIKPIIDVMYYLDEDTEEE